VAQARADRRRGGASLEIAGSGRVGGEGSGACLLILRITPEDPARRTDLDHRSSVNRHLSILGILPAQAPHGLSMAGAALKNLRLSGNQSIRQALPVFAIPIDHQRGLGVGLNIPEPLEFYRSSPLRFLVDRRVEVPAIKNKADRHDMRLTVRSSGSEMRHPRGTNKPQSGRREGRDSSHWQWAADKRKTQKSSAARVACFRS
jgi:hypothetical protein